MPNGFDVCALISVLALIPVLTFAGTVITGHCTGSNTIQITCSPPSRYIVEEIYSLHSTTNALCVASSTGAPLSSISFAPSSTSSRVYYRLKLGIEVVPLCDTGLAAGVRAYISDKIVPVNEIYTADVSPITSLNCQNRGICDLTGLEALTNLYSLDLAQNSISNIDSLMQLEGLHDLWLQWNAITNIPVLASLPCLEMLSIEQNLITDISSLSQATNMRTLYMSGNQIADISCVANMKRLERIYMADNAISNISAVDGLSSLRELIVPRNMVTNISVVASLPALSILDAGENPIGQSMTNVSAAIGLTRLHVWDTGITSLDFISALTNMTLLHAGANQFVSLAPLASLSTITELRVQNNPFISSVSPLATMTNLNIVDLGDTSVDDIAALLTNAASGGLGAGDTVYLYNCPLADAAQVDALRNVYGVTVYR
jgi:Leucine-rich repeat (LRR) protein